MSRLSDVTPEQFIRVWCAHEYIPEIAAALGLTKNAVRTRAKHYAKQGIKLPPRQYPTARGRLDVASLNKLIRSFANDNTLSGLVID